MSLEGKVAVLTGGEGPLGRAVTKKFLADGAKVVIGWYAPEEWEEAKGLIAGDYKEKFVDLHVDATKEEQVEALMKKAKDTFGTIDHLVHTVGMFRMGTTLWETEVATWEQLVDTNLKGAFLCCKHAVKVMLEKGEGRIIVFPPGNVETPGPRGIPYAASKVGLLIIMRGLREELKDTNITINAIMPGIMDTFRTRQMPHQPAPIDKWVKPSDVAELISFICSDEGKIVNGAMLRAPGGI